MIAKAHPKGLGNSEARLRRVLDQLFAFVGVLELDGTLIEANQAPLQLAGLTIDDVRGKKFWDCYWWSYDATVQERLKSAVARARRGEIVRYDVDVRMAGGRLITIDFQIAPMRDDAGRITHLIPSGSDITERKQAEERLRESEERLRTLFSSIDEGYCLCEVVLDAEGAAIDYRFLEVNPLFESMTGLVNAQGRRARELVPTLEQDWIETYARVGLGGETLRFENGSDAMGRWFDVFATPVKPHGRFALVFKDITQRKQAEKLVRESEARFRATFENAGVGMAHVALDGTWMRVNEQLCRITGYSADELRSKTFQDITHPGDLDADLGHVRRMLSGEIESYSMEKRYVRKDGSTVWVNLTGSCVRAADGSVEYFIAAIEDISERKRAQDHIQFLMRELEHRSKNLLAVVQAIARQTARHAQDMESFQDQLSARISALAKANDLLLSQDWHGAPLRDVIARQLEPFVDVKSGRVILDGPDLGIDAGAAQNIALAVHELATNAAKHGALATSKGIVSITWTLERPDAHQRFSLRWSERGGPRVEANGKRGFGSFVLERMVGAGLGGQAKLVLAPQGLVWTLTADDPSFLRAEGQARAERAMRG